MFHIMNNNLTKLSFDRTGLQELTPLLKGQVNTTPNTKHLIHIALSPPRGALVVLPKLLSVFLYYPVKTSKPQQECRACFEGCIVTLREKLAEQPN